MTFARWMRRLVGGDGGLRLASALLYGLVVIGCVATLVNLWGFRDGVIADSRQEVAGLAVALAQHLPEPLAAEAEATRLAPLHGGLGENAVIAVVDRRRGLLLSLPPVNEPGGLTADWADGMATSDWGTFDAVWRHDGIDRLWGYAAVADRPLVVVVGLSRHHATAPVTQLAWHMMALMAALAAGAILLAHLLHQLHARRRAEAALTETSRAAIVASEAKSAFLANMSHDLRTPMTGVLGMADLLAATRLDPDQGRMLATLRSSAQTLLTALDDVLDFSRIEAGELELHQRDFDLPALVEDSARLLTPMAADKGLRLSADIAADCPRWVHGDPLRLQQVLFNLVGNAVKFTETGEIAVRVERDGDAVSFAVADTGIGMNPDTLAHLFAPFTRGDESATRRHGGAGLGLAIAQRLLGLMGGTLAADSTPGAGSTFRFTLAFAPGEEQLEHRHDEAVVAPQPLRVMLAEDNPVNQTLLTHLLESMGHSVTLAEHGAQALELAATAAFDVALMDMQMPVMDGETATKLIRMLPGERARLPVVALTADAVTEHRDRYLAAGLDAFLTKPVTVAVLAQTLSAVTGTAAPAAPPPPTAQPPSAPPESEAPGLPVLDPAYLEDMRQWVGDATVLTLLATAPDSFHEELAAITAAWQAGDLRGLRENAHRLKGAAGSIGCRRLAEMAQAVQKAEDGALPEATVLEQLTAEVAAATAAAALWRPAG